MPVSIDPGSFKDPSGYVFNANGRVFRALSAKGFEAFAPVLTSGMLQRWAERGDCVVTTLSDQPASIDAAAVLEHARIPFLSYPYEWPFALLKRAALLHLDLQIEALDAGFSFSDSSAYNIQFIGAKPVLIDVLSLRPYRDGEYWEGYKQFCEQFLNPLLLTAKLGLPYASWYRGALHGIGIEETAKLLPWRSKFSPSLLAHVHLHAKLTASARHGAHAKKAGSKPPLAKARLRGLLTSMRSFVAGLSPKDGDTFWAAYEKTHSYDATQADVKREFIEAYAANTSPKLLFDFGCNGGAYSEAAIRHGTQRIIGFDFDEGALAAAVSRADDKSLALTPLFLDISNPSPEQGWRQMERQGFAARAQADGLLALALIHHMVIGRNIPLAQAVAWLVSTASTGVIEFVPKSDPMVIGMLSSRDDIFDDYTSEQFETLLRQHADILRQTASNDHGRTLYEFRRK